MPEVTCLPWLYTSYTRYFGFSYILRAFKRIVNLLNR